MAHFLVKARRWVLDPLGAFIIAKKKKQEILWAYLELVPIEIQIQISLGGFNKPNIHPVYTWNKELSWMHDTLLHELNLNSHEG